MRTIAILLLATWTALVVLPGAATAEPVPVPTHVTVWAPTGEVLAPGDVRVEYTVPGHLGAAVGLADRLELRLDAGAPQPPVQLYTAGLTLRGQLVRAGSLRLTVGAIGGAAALDEGHLLVGAEATIGLHDGGLHVAYARRHLRDPDGGAAVDVDVATASVAIGGYRIVAAVGRVRDATAPRCPAPPSERGATTCAPAVHGDAAALGFGFRGGRVTGVVGLGVASFAGYPPVPLPYLTVSIPVR